MRIRSRMLMLGAALIWVAVSAQAKLPWGDNYWAYTYKSFDVVADGFSSNAQKIALELERFDIAFMQVTRLKLGDWRPLTHIYVLDPSVMKLVWPNPTPLQSAYRNGEFASDIVVSTEVEDDNLYRGAYFGYAGALLGTLGQHFPNWYLQGVDELFAATAVRTEEVLIGSYSEAQVRSLAKNPWIPMREVLRLKGGDPQLRDLNYSYQYESECWLLLHMMLIEGTRRDEMNTYLQALGNGVPEEQAFAQSFKGRYEDLDSDLRAIIFKGQLAMIKVKIPPVTDKIVALRISDAQAQARLAELTIRENLNVDYGLTLAAQSLAAEPGNEVALRALAAGQLNKSQFAEAYASVQTLYALATLSSASHYEAARIYTSIARAVDQHRADVGVEAPQLWAQARDAYSVALSLDPNDLQALAGYESLLQMQKDRDAIRAFLPQAEKAVYHNPHYGWLARNVSSMHSMLGDFDDAIVFAQAWKRASFSASDRDSADAYIAQLRASKARQDAAGNGTVPQ